MVVARNDIVFLTEYLTVGVVVVDFSIEWSENLYTKTK